MKNFKLFKKLICLVPVVCASVVLPLTSCAKKEKEQDVKKVKLSCENTTLTAGDKTQIIVNNDLVEPNQFIWSIECQSNQIYVLQSGVACVANNFSADEIITATITATYKKNPKVTGKINVSAVPAALYDTPSNLLGFEYNSLSSYERDCETPYSVRIIKKPGSTREYQLEKPINLFDKLPRQGEDEWDWINFKPIYKKDANRMTRWQHTNVPGVEEKYLFLTTPEGETTRAEWGKEIDYCPGVFLNEATILSDKITVEFLCDGVEPDKMPILTIDFNCWMKPIQTSAPVFSYNPAEGDSHRMTPTGMQGSYNIQAFCPSKSTGQVYTQNLSQIYCCKQLHEFSNYVFQFELEEGLDPRVQEAFSWKLSYSKTFREVDNFPMYRLSFSYTFDMTLMPSAKEMSYANFTVGKIVATDIEGKEKKYDQGWINFVIDWI